MSLGSLARRCLLTIIAGFLTLSCSDPEMLSLNRYRLRDATDLPPTETLARAEALHHLHGAITEDERRARQGEYYTARWDARGEALPLTLVFEYQQARSASKVLRKSIQLEEATGRTSFAIIGDEYKANGRVLAWKLTLRNRNGVLATRRSYLWED